MRMAMMGSVLRAKCMSAMLMGGLALGLASSSAAVAAPAGDSPGDPARFSELMARAEAYRAEGVYAKSARALTEAYAALGERDQGGAKGEITVNNAVDDFKLAQEQDPENVALLEEEAALLERFGTHAKRKGVLPEGLAEELARVKAKIDEVGAAAKAKAEEQRKADEAAKAEAEAKLQRKADEAAKAEAQRKAANEEVVGIEDRPSRRKADAAIVGVGAVSVAGGVALVASGAWNIGNVRRRGDELLAAIDANEGGTPEMREALRGDIEAWRKEWRGIGTGLVVGGAVLAAAGVGLTTWGVVRMRRGKQGAGQATVVRPMLSGGEVGLVVMGRW